MLIDMNQSIHNNKAMKMKTITLDDNITQIICPDYTTYSRVIETIGWLIPNHTTMKNSIFIPTDEITKIEHILKQLSK